MALPLLEQQLEQEIKAAIDQGYRTFLTGLAMGVDLWASEIVLQLKEENPAIQLVCFQPCETQAESWPLEWRTLYHEIIRQSDNTFCLQYEYTDDCMLRRNRIMVELSSKVIAVHDGRSDSGTAYTVDFAQTNGIDTVIINPSGLVKALESNEKHF
jgi:uncharacterized phage-like protein YoqJ